MATPRVGPADPHLRRSGIGLLSVLLVATAWVLEAADPIIAQRSGLAPVALSGLVVVAAVVGLVTARTRLRPATAHAAALGLGAVAMLLTGAWLVRADPVPLETAVFQALEAALSGRPQRAILLPMLGWGAFASVAGYLAAFDLARNPASWRGVVALGMVMLVAAVRVPTAIVLPAMALFASGALGLLVRAALLDRRRSRGGVRLASVGRPDALSAWGGGLVGLTAVVGAAALALTASGAPLAGIGVPWSGAGSAAHAAMTLVERAPIADAWSASEEPLFTVRPADGVGRYLRRQAFSTFDGSGWLPDERAVVRPVAAMGDGLATDGDQLTLPAGWTRSVVTDVMPVAATLRAGDAIVAPAIVHRVDRSTIVHADPDGPWSGITLGVPQTGTGYRVVSEIVDEDVAASLASRLAARSGPLPDWLDAYRARPAAEMLDEGARRLAHALRDAPGGRDAFHVARRLETWFSGADLGPDDAPRFRYATSVQGQCAPGRSVVGCLLESRVGFCQHYATAMTLLLRELDIPARYVEGFLPGRAAGDGTWTVPAAAAHAWVEVWFAGAGWQRFDPTPGRTAGYGQASAWVTVDDPEGVAGILAPGAAASSPTPPVAGAVTARPSAGTVTAVEEGGAGGVEVSAPVGLALLLLIIAVGLAGVRIRGRRTVGADPGSTRDAEAIYRALVVEAGTRGWAPRRGQTDHEFVAHLATVIPSVTTDLHQVATARVAARYGPPGSREPASDALVEAFRRARSAIRRLPLGGRRG